MPSNYQKPDSTEITFTYGELRNWADQCGVVKDWMKVNLPSDLFRRALLDLKKGDVVSTPTGYAIVNYIPNNKWGFSMITGTVGNSYGGPFESLEKLNEYAQDQGFTYVRFMPDIKDLF